MGSFVANLTVIHLNNKNSYVAHSIPIVLEIICLVTVSTYGDNFYKETLFETEILLSILLFAMGLQNGLTASISNFSIKTTHLTGTTTDLGILFSMFTKKEFRNNKTLKQRAKLLSSITLFYLSGAIIAGFTYISLGFKMFYVVSIVLVFIIVYDLYKIRLKQYWHKKRLFKLNLVELKENIIPEKEKRVA